MSDSLIRRAMSFANRQVHSSRAETLRYAVQGLNRRTPIVVYQMGKVGSQTVCATLEVLRVPNPVYHVHFLSDAGLGAVEADIARLRREFVSGYLRQLRRDVVHTHYIASKALRKRLDSGRDRSLLVITLVRDPVARRLSAFIETMWNFHPELIDATGRVRVAEAIAVLQGEYARFDETTDTANTWFERELKAALGVDIYRHPFDQEAGYSVIEHGRLRLLALTLERLNENTKVLSQFLELGRGISLVTSNVTTDKATAAAYRAVTSGLRLPREILQRIYSAKMVCHFYSPGMRERFIQRWSA